MMILKILRFYLVECFRLAARGFLGAVTLWASVLGLLAFVFTRVVNWNEDLEQQLVDAATSYFLLGACALLLCRMLIWAPYKLHEAERTERERLVREHRPTLQVSVPWPDATTKQFGTTQELLNGRRQSIETGRGNMILLHCENTGQFAALDCRAQLTAAREIVGKVETEIPMTEFVDLLWGKSETADAFKADIAPSETKLVWLGFVPKMGCLRLNRELKNLPFEYHRLFDHPGKFRLSIQISSSNMTPIQTLLEIECSEADDDTPLSAGGTASIALVE